VLELADDRNPKGERAPDRGGLAGNPGALDHALDTLEQLFPITIQAHFDAQLTQPLGTLGHPGVGADHLLPTLGQQPGSRLARTGQPNDQERPLGQGRTCVTRNHLSRFALRTRHPAQNYPNPHPHAKRCRFVPLSGTIVQRLKRTTLLQVFEAVHTEGSSAAPAAVWALWADASRWPEWNEQLESGELDGEPAVGAGATVKFKRGGRMRFTVVAVEPERLFIDEAKLPGCRFGHEHRVEPASAGCEITHRLYLRGPTSGFFSRLFGRRRMRQSVVGFIERERALAE
jgi:hypothetical protein